MGVRITSKLDRLKELSRENKGEFYYGVVDYKWKYQLDKLPKDKNVINALKIAKPSKEHIKTLLLKRKSYSYEKELRLFCIPDNSLIDSTNKSICRLKLDPMKLITSIRFDPGMEYSEFRKHKENLVHNYGFKPTQITQSTYFKKNKYIIRLD